METIHPELALYGSKNVCARTNTVFFPISEVCDGTVSLTNIRHLLAYNKFKYIFPLQDLKVSHSFVRETVPSQTSDIRKKTLSVLAHSFLLP